MYFLLFLVSWSIFCFVLFCFLATSEIFLCFFLFCLYVWSNEAGPDRELNISIVDYNQNLDLLRFWMIFDFVDEINENEIKVSCNQARSLLLVIQYSRAAPVGSNQRHIRQIIQNLIQLQLVCDVVDKKPKQQQQNFKQI